MELQMPANGESTNCPHYTSIESSSSPTYFLNDASSPGRAGSYFFSCPASPVHYILTSPPYSSSSAAAGPSRAAIDDPSVAGPFEFDGAAPSGTMTSADELFFNGQIRPLKLSSHRLRSQPLAALPDFNDEEEQAEEEEEGNGERGRETWMRSRSLHRRTRSMSPLRSPRLQWQGEEAEKQDAAKEPEAIEPDPNESAATPPESASSSRSSSTSSSSSSGRNSKRWILLKDLLLYRSKSEGSERGNGRDKEKFWHSISFSPSSKSKSAPLTTPADPSPAPNKARREKRPANGVGRRPGAATPSAHERHYAANRAQTEEMRRRTFLPYRPGLLGCLGFTSRSYGAFDGLTKAFNIITASKKQRRILVKED